MAGIVSALAAVCLLKNPLAGGDLGYLVLVMRSWLIASGARIVLSLLGVGLGLGLRTGAFGAILSYLVLDAYQNSDNISDE